jgi:hypothetical protein
MLLNPNAPVLIITAVFVWVGSYLIIRPQQYKDELGSTGDDPISRSPPWAGRILGVVTIVTGLVVSYLVLTTSK